MSIAIAACAGSSGVRNEPERPAEQEVIPSGRTDETADPAIVDLLKSAVEWHLPDGPDKIRSPRTWDLVHQQISLRFHFPERTVIGRSTLVLKPIDPQQPIEIDAKMMTVSNVTVFPNGIYTSSAYDSLTLSVFINASRLKRNDSVIVTIDYLAKPPYQTGLHFVDPDGIDVLKPTQIWTLGQPEDNSYWMPTIDRPDEKSSHELWLAVPDSFITVSNGDFLYARKNPGDSLTTHYWRFNAMHSPYLTGFAAGPFKTVREKTGKTTFYYHVEPDFENTALKFMQHTVPAYEFLEPYFEKPFPWPAYHQTAVREFPAGGMENTGSTLLFDGIQSDLRGYAEAEQEDIIVHELAHQWIGNLATAADWPHVYVQEGLATFFEIKYRRRAAGKSAAQYRISESRSRYLEQAGYIRHPLLWKNYEDPYDVFDEHSYDKAGLVFLMLESVIGESAFKAAIADFVSRYEFQTYETSDLQVMLENHSGKSLQSFFSTWVEQPGHPVIEIKIQRVDNKSTMVQLNQIQDLARQPRFPMPVHIEWIYQDNTSHTSRFYWTGQDTTVDNPLNKPVSDVYFDPEGYLLTEIEEEPQSNLQVLKRLESPFPMIQLRMLQKLEEKQDLQEGFVQKLIDLLKNDMDWFIREKCWHVLIGTGLRNNQLKTLALSSTVDAESDWRVRIRALEYLVDEPGNDVETHIQKLLEDPSYYVAADAIRAIGHRNPFDVIHLVKPAIKAGSYNYVLEEAYIDAITFSTEPSAWQELEFFTRIQTSRNFSVEALRALYTRVQQGIMPSPQKQQAFQFFQSYAGNNFLEKRMVAYQALSKIDPAGAAVVLDERVKSAESPEERMFINQIRNR